MRFSDFSLVFSASIVDLDQTATKDCLRFALFASAFRKHSLTQRKDLFKFENGKNLLIYKNHSGVGIFSESMCELTLKCCAKLQQTNVEVFFCFLFFCFLFEKIIFHVNCLL